MKHAVISWNNLQQSDYGKVHYDTVSRKGNKSKYQFISESSRFGKVTMKKMDFVEGVTPGFYYHTELNGLKPNTKYYFTLENDGKFSDEYYFITAPDDIEKIKFVAGGDSRLGGDKPRYAGRTPHIDRQNVMKLIAKLIDENPDIYAMIHGADFGTTADWRHLYWFFDDMKYSYGSDNRILPYFVSMGNHDTEIGFLENFYLGEDNINEDIAFSYYYSSKVTNDISLITLNTEISLTGEQYHWLEEELPELREKSKWLLVNYHKPAFPAVKDTNEYKFKRVRDNWIPLFEKYNIDLAIESDGHSLKRTIPIRNGKIDLERGITYIGEGGLGAPLREPDTNRWFLKGGFASKDLHVWLIEVTRKSIDLKAIGIENQLFDNHKIFKKLRQ
ncbi:MAG: metallophosphoesterase family protein [Candidatus Kapabacteria bacterium]|nr:metallophosphoesterase family protein [Ignavibacteriota bacterium]MCW5883389.1 metallophosphoesterase family protein [Candidatus Kapabacteria bacterium]